MADDRFEPREGNWQQWLPWTVLFRGFQVALDPKKLLLAAAGILVMACFWWLLAAIFYSSSGDRPSWRSGDYDARIADYQARGESAEQARERAFQEFKQDRARWNLLYETAGTPTAGKGEETLDPADIAAAEDLNLEQYEQLVKDVNAGAQEKRYGERVYRVGAPLVYGRLRTWPWFEDRGPNPYLLVVGKAGHPGAEGAARYTPWEHGHFVDWLLTQQVPVLIEPLVKFLRPVVYLLHPYAGFWNRLYFLLVTLFTLATWAVFGGAITRMAAVQVARNEKIGMTDSLRFVAARKWSYLFATLAPLVFVAFLVVLLVLFGIGNLIPIFGEFWVGLLFPLVLLAGLAMAVVLVGLVGWPMIHATLSAEGSDSFDALSRSYSYVYQSPWSYIWYCVVALAYGAVVVFFVGLMGSLMVYLGKWAISQTPGATQLHRDPSYMFIWAPTSFGWRDLLLQGSQEINPADFRAWNWIGTFLVTLWLYLVFLMIVGFGYSYFWSQSTIIYLLMRRKVDDTDLDEVYLEEEETEEAYSAPMTSSATVPASAPAAGGMTMVDSPTLRPPAPAVATPKPPAVPEGVGSEVATRTPPAPAASPPVHPETAPTESGDGNTPAADQP